METTHFHIVHTKFFLRTTWFHIKGVPINNLTPMKNVLEVQGYLHLMPGYSFYNQIHVTTRLANKYFMKSNCDIKLPCKIVNRNL